MKNCMKNVSKENPVGFICIYLWKEKQCAIQFTIENRDILGSNKNATKNEKNQYKGVGRYISRYKKSRH